MSFRSETRERLTKVEAKLEVITKLLEQKNLEVERLIKQNTDLMDRFMSADWSSYINQTPDRWEGGKITEIDESPLTNVENAGEILSDEDIGK